jgi:hypothetical protein
MPRAWARGASLFLFPAKQVFFYGQTTAETAETSGGDNPVSGKDQRQWILT